MSKIEMSIKKLISIWIISTVIVSFSNSASFSISPEYSELNSKCETAIDIMIDSEWAEVAAADMILLFNTWEITPLCFVPWDFLNIWWWMYIKWKQIKVTSYQYPWYSKWKWKFWTFIFRPFSTIKSTTLYFDVKKIWVKETAGDSNISRPWGWDILDKAGFAKYNFVEWKCKKIDPSLLKDCKIYDNSWSMTTFVKEYKKEIDSWPNLIIIWIRAILFIFIIIAIIRKFIIKPQDTKWKN